MPIENIDVYRYLIRVMRMEALPEYLNKDDVRDVFLLAIAYTLHNRFGMDDIAKTIYNRVTNIPLREGLKIPL